MSRVFSYETLKKKYSAELDGSITFFEYIIRTCAESSLWWITLHSWWAEMDSECKKSFFRYLVEKGFTTYAFDLIDKRIRF